MCKKSIYQNYKIKKDDTNNKKVTRNIYQLMRYTKTNFYFKKKTI